VDYRHCLAEVVRVLGRPGAFATSNWDRPPIGMPPPGGSCWKRPSALAQPSARQIPWCPRRVLLVSRERPYRAPGGWLHHGSGGFGRARS
jgi:hypothetical protein